MFVDMCSTLSLGNKIGKCDVQIGRILGNRSAWTFEPGSVFA
jgi:hypothetical protein